jgi:predicted P-loop ATPase
MLDRLNPILPAALKNSPSWVCWRAEQRKGKWTKVPYNPSHPSEMAKSNDPQTWGTFEEACESFESGQPRKDGVGIVLVDDLVGYDLDVKDDPEREQIAQQILREAAQEGLYTERSPSKKGYRIFLRGKLPRAGKGSPHSWIEAYDQSSPRYLTVTGDRVYLNEIDDLPTAQGWIEDIHLRFFKKPTPPKSPPPTPKQGRLSLGDGEVIEKIRASASGAEFSRLFGGDTGDDHSAADLALCNILAWWTNKDAAQMDRIFRSSGLMRPKWDKKHHSDGRTYGEGTIEKAISDCAGGYDPTYRSDPPRPQRASEQPSEAVDLSWKLRLLEKFSKEGIPLGYKAVGINAQRILANDHRWRGVLAFDESANAPVFAAAPPYHADYADPNDRSFPRLVEDSDYVRIGYWLLEEYAINLGTEVIAASILVASQFVRVHPVRDYLAALAWDGAKRLDGWLAQFLGARAMVVGGEEGEAYVRNVGRWWLLSAVARAFKAGCKADHVLVLEGDEGIGKSTALQILGGAAFSDTQIDIQNKDAYLHIRGKWIVELAELDSLMRAESSTAKAFFTSSVDRYRAPYGRNMIEVPRGCVFAGSVNHSDYIRDASGGRRYWPVACAKIDLAGLAAVRDQLWAEAVAEFRAGAKWWPTAEATKTLRAEQHARHVDDPWETTIADFLDGKKFATPQQILAEGLALPNDKQDRRAQTRVGILLQRMGWLRKRDRNCCGHLGAVTTYYVPPPPPEQQTAVQPLEVDQRLYRLNTRATSGDDQPVQPVQPQALAGAREQTLFDPPHLPRINSPLREF